MFWFWLEDNNNQNENDKKILSSIELCNTKFARALNKFGGPLMASEAIIFFLIFHTREVG